MSLAATTYEHIVIDPNGVPVIAGATTKVLELVLSHFQRPLVDTLLLVAESHLCGSL